MMDFMSSRTENQKVAKPEISETSRDLESLNGGAKRKRMEEPALLKLKSDATSPP